MAHHALPFWRRPPIHRALSPTVLGWFRAWHPQGPVHPQPHPLSLTVLRWSHAWHPQGPIHPQPHPVPLHVVHPRSHARRAVTWWRGGSPTCRTPIYRGSTGRQGGAVGPLRVPGPTARRSMHGCPKTVRERANRTPCHYMWYTPAPTSVGPSPGRGAVPRHVVARGGRVEWWGPCGCQDSRRRSMHACPKTVRERGFIVGPTCIARVRPPGAINRAATPL